MTCALLGASSIGASLVKALATLGTFALALMGRRGKLFPTCVEGHIALNLVYVKSPHKRERIICIPARKFISPANGSIGLGYKIANVNGYVGDFVSATRIKAYSCRDPFATKDVLTRRKSENHSKSKQK